MAAENTRGKLGDALTKQERNIALLRLEGLSHKEIAERLVVSPRTVEKHMSEIYVKTGAHNTMAVYRYFQRRGEAGMDVG